MYLHGNIYRDYVGKRLNIEACVNEHQEYRCLLELFPNFFKYD